MSDKDDKLIEDIQKEFDRSVGNIDAATASRITQARHRALEKAGQKPSPLTTWLPLSAFATACLAMVIFMTLPNQTQNDPLLQEDLDLISSSEELDLYEELEFYEWLEDYELPS